MIMLILKSFFLYFFFFSSRRRHTRSLCDWSSGRVLFRSPRRVGLGHPQPLPRAIMVPSAVRRFLAVCAVIAFVEPLAAQGVQAPPLTVHAIWGSREYASEIGRASCRESVEGPGGAGHVKT